MTASTVIPEALEDALLEMSGSLNPTTSRRYTTRELSVWLRERHEVEASHTAVGRVLRRLRAEQTETRREVIRARLHEGLGRQLQVVDDVFDKLFGNFTATRKRPLSTGAQVELSEELRKITELKLRFSGIGEKVEHSGEVDMTTGGKALTFYVPQKREDGDSE